MIISDYYELHEKLGQGGMGEVFRAVDTRSGETVAVKLLKSELVASEPDIVTRFAREGEALRQLNHPNIVKVLGTAHDDGQHYLIMEYVAGGSLYDVMKSPQSVSQVLNIALELADALTRAHHLKIIHRDIKPANVLIAEDGTPRLTDFGVAQMGKEKRLTETGVAVGTLDYLSPEALNGETIDARSDIWAFGVMLYEMLAGKRPFEGDNLTSTLTAILLEPIPDLESLRPNVPVALVDLIYRMLEKDRNQRIPSVRQVGAELEAIMQGRETPSSASAREISDGLFDTPTPAANIAKHNLPAQTTPFVGRQHELDEITGSLSHSNVRLVTILASGGMGKTRLALEVGTRYIGSSHNSLFTNGVYFVALAPLTSPDNIVSAIAEAVGFQFYQGGEPKQQLLDYFSEKALLLVMDNFEHVLGGASIVADVLAAALNVKVLATSRERLNLSGETLFTLSGLDSPDLKSREDALNTSAVKLFVQSAKRVRPNFELSDEDLASVTRICRLVDGIPLGIVLAAAWVEMLSPQEIADEIAQSLDFLETEMRDIPERHRSIRAVFDYSWNLLSEDERAVFPKLSVFRGGFTREAAQAVAGASLKILMALVTKSLIRRNPDTGRYEIHELLRQYGEAQLAKVDELQKARDAHAAYYADFVSQREEDLKGRRQKAGLDEIETDFENVRVAWQWAVQQKHDVTLDKMLEGVKFLCEMRSRYQDRREFFGQAREQLAPQSGEAPHPVWCRAVVRYAGFLEHREDSTAQFQQFLEVAQKQNNAAETAYCLFALGDLTITLRNPVKALEYLLDSVARYRAIGDQYYIEHILNRIAFCYSNMRQRDKYFEVAQESLNLARSIGDQIGTGWALHSIGTAALITDDVAECERCFQEANAIWHSIGNLAGIATSTNLLGNTAFMKGNFEQAKNLAEKGLEISTDRNYLQGKGTALTILGQIAIATEDYSTAEARFIEAEPLIAPHPHWRSVVEFGLWAVAYTKGNAELARHRLQAGLSLGQPLGIIAISGVLTACAIVATTNGKPEFAAELLGMIFPAAQNTSGWLEKWSPFIRIRSQLQNELGEETYLAALERGKSRDLDATVKELLAELG